jgi:hypothetical protein
MQLPGPVRAVVGLFANAADEAKHLPDRAIELPMLAVSTALQMSLRAQQRYARLAARGDEVLNRSRPTDEPPPWATFDEPVSVDELRGNGAPNTAADRARAASELLDELLELSDPAPTDAAQPAESAGDGDRAPVTDIADAAARKAPARKASVKKAPVKKAPAKDAPAGSGTAGKAAASKAPARKAAAKAPDVTAPDATAPDAKTADAPNSADAQPNSADAQPNSADAAPGPDDPASTAPKAKTVSKPRHSPPSAFDSVDDD